MTAGYSGTPLARKLGLAPGMAASVIDPPEGYGAWLGDAVPAWRPLEAGVAFVHLFITDRAALAEALPRLMALIARDGMIWVSWPKRASRVPTDITEDVIRAVCLPLGLVDVKVCAVSEVWSGLKLVIRKELR